MWKERRIKVLGFIISVTGITSIVCPVSMTGQWTNEKQIV
jgi:hypothetical protein